MSRASDLILVGLTLLCVVLAILLNETRGRLERLEYQQAEIRCTHRVYEDGSAVHLDAEVAAGCLHRDLGWPLATR